jgi:transposase
MKGQEQASLLKRYVALDIHKHYVMVGAMDRSQTWVMRPRKIRMTQLEKWCARHLRASDEVVLESTSNAWTIYDALAPMVARLVVANPLKVRQITQAQVKTDKLALEALLVLLIADLVPEVWVPPVEVRELRGLISHRWRVHRQLVMVKNRLQSVLHRLNLEAPEGGALKRKNRDWWAGQGFSRTQQLQIEQDLRLLDELTNLKAEVHAELTRLSNQAPWADQAVYVMQLPGWGCILTMTVLAAIGDISRFPTAKHLVGYAGLGAGVHASGQKHQGKKITKAGRKELRWAPVEAVRTAVRTDPYWQEEYARLCARMPKHKALVALARRMLVVIWHVLSKQEARRRATADMLAYKMLVWASLLRKEDLHGLTRSEFAKYSLLRLGVAEDLTRLVRGRVVRVLPSVAELWQRHPDLTRPQ